MASKLQDHMREIRTLLTFAPEGPGVLDSLRIGAFVHQALVNRRTGALCLFLPSLLDFVSENAEEARVLFRPQERDPEGSADIQGIPHETHAGLIGAESKILPNFSDFAALSASYGGSVRPTEDVDMDPGSAHQTPYSGEEGHAGALPGPRSSLSALVLAALCCVGTLEDKEGFGGEREEEKELFRESRLTAMIACMRLVGSLGECVRPVAMDKSFESLVRAVLSLPPLVALLSIDPERTLKSPLLKGGQGLGPHTHLWEARRAALGCVTPLLSAFPVLTRQLLEPDDQNVALQVFGYLSPDFARFCAAAPEWLWGMGSESEGRETDTDTAIASLQLGAVRLLESGLHSGNCDEGLLVLSQRSRVLQQVWHRILERRGKSFAPIDSVEAEDREGGGEEGDIVESRPEHKASQELALMGTLGDEGPSPVLHRLVSLGVSSLRRLQERMAAPDSGCVADERTTALCGLAVATVRCLQLCVAIKEQAEARSLEGRQGQGRVKRVKREREEERGPASAPGAPAEGGMEGFAFPGNGKCGVKTEAEKENEPGPASASARSAEVVGNLSHCRTVDFFGTHRALAILLCEEWRESLKPRGSLSGLAEAGFGHAVSSNVLPVLSDILRFCMLDGCHLSRENE
uniref:Uncharacterized protein n=1 Tax=Chromera velia CCMP2878 TaxID=1169474 RepID=A0A0G4HLR9_9ALVE|eukprot:Cvel_7383.t1-p1 / transcript=Cvel_7383.t1 / gene=Cvel_7383 / organism=Chromera_velia_CCMP2878 / gene_product=hypothetical protein / transcript_product=hypothetical protein / location=Cvel_scaffold384:61941-65573(-) / protein_length=633 / sequence_SO=supercontig / SO=protein_coding / is_pseudo=false